MLYLFLIYINIHFFLLFLFSLSISTYRRYNFKTIINNLTSFFISTIIFEEVDFVDKLDNNQIFDINAISRLDH